jgi:predicted esterase YcpF (UPF0227 family)
MWYYIHGYQSSPDSTKGKLFKEALGAQPIKYRDCHPEELVIADCLDNISRVIERDSDVVLIGSSLGGFLAAEASLRHSHVRRLVLLNPAVIPPEVDITTINGMPQRILKDMQDGRLFENVLDAEVFILRGTADDVVPESWVLEFAMSQEATVKFMHDDHRFTRYIACLPEIILGIMRTKH